MSQEFRLKSLDEKVNYFPKKNKAKWLDEQKIQKDFSFYNCWMYLNFYYCFFNWYSYRSYEFCNRIKNYPVTSQIKRHNPIIKTKKNGHENIPFLAKSWSSSI